MSQLNIIQLLGIFHLQQIFVLVMSKIPKSWDINPNPCEKLPGKSSSSTLLELLLANAAHVVVAIPAALHPGAKDNEEYLMTYGENHG